MSSSIPENPPADQKVDLHAVTPTEGMRLKVEILHLDGGGKTPIIRVEQWGDDVSLEQAIFDAGLFNDLLEVHEQRTKNLQMPKEDSSDVLVDLGDLTKARFSTQVDAYDFQMQVVDYVDTFNHGVVQGVPPARALQAFGNALGIVLGSCMRANMPVVLAHTVIKTLMEVVEASSKHLKIITTSQRNH